VVFSVVARDDALARAPRERATTRRSVDRIASRLGVRAFARGPRGASALRRASDLVVDDPARKVRRSVRERPRASRAPSFGGWARASCAPGRARRLSRGNDFDSE
jgi:hypothetical protein